MSEAGDILDELDREAEQAVANAEREAIASGKERFDLATFERLLNRGSQAKRAKGHREMYYLSYPEIRTLAGYVKMLHEAEPYEDSR